MFAAGKGDVPKVMLSFHTGGPFVYHDRLWLWSTVLEVPQGPPRPGVRAQHDAYLGVDGKGGPGASRITHSHRIACGMDQLWFTGNGRTGHLGGVLGTRTLAWNGWKEGRRHGMNFVPWVGFCCFSDEELPGIIIRLIATDFFHVGVHWQFLHGMVHWNLSQIGEGEA